MSEAKKILVIDDSEFDRNLISKVLKKKGFEVLTLESAENWHEFILAERPDLILLDVVMDSVDGNQVLHSIRSKYNSVQLPVIMMTGNSDASDIVKSLSLGANDYIVKPVNSQITILRVMTHLEISDLCKEMANLKEIEAINAMIVTYNHELNNPLTIAIASLAACIDRADKTDFERLESSLWRMTDIIKKIDAVTKPKPIEYVRYTNSSPSKMVKIK